MTPVVALERKRSLVACCVHFLAHGLPGCFFALQSVGRILQAFRRKRENGKSDLLRNVARGESEVTLIAAVDSLFSFA